MWFAVTSVYSHIFVSHLVVKWLLGNLCPSFVQTLLSSWSTCSIMMWTCLLGQEDLETHGWERPSKGWTVQSQSWSKENSSRDQYWKMSNQGVRSYPWMANSQTLSFQGNAAWKPQVFFSFWMRIWEIMFIRKPAFPNLKTILNKHVSVIKLSLRHTHILRKKFLKNLTNWSI